MIKKTCLAIGVWLKLVSSPVVFAQEKHSLQPEKKKFCEALNREMQITMGNWLATLNGWKAYDGARGEAIKEDKEALGQFIAERRDMIIENHQDNRIKLKDEAIILGALCKKVSLKMGHEQQGTGCNRV